MTLPRLSVVPGLWPDRPAEENLTVGLRAAELGFPELWIGEMATYDAPALATALGRAAPVRLTLGPLAVHVRTPLTIAMATASVGALTGCPTGVALGTSSPVVVERWHGRTRAGGPAALARSALTVRRLLEGERVNGYRLRLPAPEGWSVSVAAFGPGAVAVAAEHADRMVANLVTVEVLAELRAALERAAGSLGRPVPALAVWVTAAVDPGPGALDQMRFALVAYLAAPGYAEMFRRAGFGAVVDAALGGASPRDLLRLVPDEMLRATAAIGDEPAVRRRLAEYVAAGAKEVCVVPITAGDDGAERTLRALSPAAS